MIAPTARSRARRIATRGRSRPAPAAPGTARPHGRAVDRPPAVGRRRARNKGPRSGSGGASRHDAARWWAAHARRGPAGRVGERGRAAGRPRRQPRAMSQAHARAARSRNTRPIRWARPRRAGDGGGGAQAAAHPPPTAALRAAARLSATLTARPPNARSAADRATGRKGKAARPTGRDRLERLICPDRGREGRHNQPQRARQRATAGLVAFPRLNGTSATAVKLHLRHN